MTSRRSARQYAIILGFGLIGWALCAAIMGVGSALLGMRTTLVVHAIGAPVIFALLSYVYSRRFGYTSPLATAFVFLGIVVFMDFFVVATLALRSYDMFASFIGTWLPFALIFASTYVTGLLVERSGRPKTASA